jgi:hypothetical protein
MCWGGRIPNAPAIAGAFLLELRQGHLLQVIDFGLISLVKDPFLNPLGTNQPGLAQDLEMFARGRLTDAQLAGDQHPAHTVRHQIAVHLWREMLNRVLEPA